MDFSGLECLLYRRGEAEAEEEAEAEAEAEARRRRLAAAARRGGSPRRLARRGLVMRLLANCH